MFGTALIKKSKIGKQSLILLLKENEILPVVYKFFLSIKLDFFDKIL